MDHVHSHVGGSFMRGLVDFETDAAGMGDAGGDGGGDVAVVDAPADDTGAVDGAAAEPVVDDTPAAWMPPDTPEAREWIDREFDARLTQWANQFPQDQGDQQQPYDGQQQVDAGNPFATPLPDPLDEGFGPALDSRLMALAQFMQEGLQQVAQQAQAPFQAQQFQQAATEGTERAKDILADLAAREGDFNQEAAQQLWKVFSEPHVERYGMTSHAAELGLRDSAAFIRGIEKTAYERGREAYKNELDGLTGVRGEPGAGAFGGANGAQTLSDSQNPDEITRRYSQQAHALRNSGG
jgi:hypothetical protein